MLLKGWLATRTGKVLAKLVRFQTISVRHMHILLHLFLFNLCLLRVHGMKDHKFETNGKARRFGNILLCSLMSYTERQSMKEKRANMETRAFILRRVLEMGPLFSATNTISTFTLICRTHALTAVRQLLQLLQLLSLLSPLSLLSTL